MRKIIPLLLLALILLSSVALASQTKGVICACDDNHIVIGTNNGYTCGDISYYLPYGVHAGDYVVGELEMYGFYEIYDIDADTSFNIYIDEFWLSSEDAVRWLHNRR